MSETIDINLVRCNKAFFRFVLAEMGMSGLTVAVALEEIAMEIRQQSARE